VVAYVRLGDADAEKEALQKAVVANDHFAPAFVNLGQMEMRVHNFSEAEHDFEKEVIATVHKAHAMSHGSFARVHYIAARACERLNLQPGAVS